VEFLSPDDVAPNRRRAHQRAVDIVRRSESGGKPFALVLRTYRVTQLFADAPEGFQATQMFENVLHDELEPLGLGAVTVQDRGLGSELQYPAADASDRELEVRAPALCVATEGWLTTVRSLIVHAGLIVVLLQVDTPGVLQELEAIAAMGRADQTVVAVLVSRFTDPPPEPPILAEFFRVISTHELDAPPLVDHFLVKDLVDGMRLGRTTTETHWPPVVEGYEQLARSERGRRALSDAATSYGRAARISLRLADYGGAVRQTVARSTVLEQLGDAAEAGAVLKSLADAMPAATDGATRLARAELDAATAHRLATDDNAEAALTLLERSRRHAEEADDHRSLSVLHTAGAWIRRGQLDVFGAMTAAHEAVAHAERAGSAAELWRSCTVLGILWGDLGEWSPRGVDCLARAVAAMPDSGAEADLWMVLMTRGRLAAQAGDWSTATRAYLAAARAATAADLPAEARTARERLLTALAHTAAPA